MHKCKVIFLSDLLSNYLYIWIYLNILQQNYKKNIYIMRK